MSHTLDDSQVEQLRAIAKALPTPLISMRNSILQLLPQEPLAIRIAVFRADGSIVGSTNLSVDQDEIDNIEKPKTGEEGQPFIDFLRNAVEIALQGADLRAPAPEPFTADPRD